MGKPPPATRTTSPWPARRSRLAANATLTLTAQATAVVRPWAGDLDRLDIAQAMQWQVIRTVDVTENPSVHSQTATSSTASRRRPPANWSRSHE